MTETFSDEKARLSELSERVSRLEQRLDDLEKRPAAAVTAAPGSASRSPRPAGPVAQEPAVPGREIDISLAGKSLIGLGGAYFLRAITESQWIPKIAGLALGLLYAAFWMWLARRHAERGERHGATFAMVVAALVAYPLIWEATARFNIFNAGVATIAAMVASTVLLWIAAKYDLSVGAWIASFGLIACTAGVMVAAERIAVPLIGFTLTGAAVWEIANRKEWEIAAWPTAIVSWLAAMPLILLSVEHRGNDPAPLTVLALLIMTLSYLGVITARSFSGHPTLGFVDVAQSIAVVIVGFAGAARVASGTPFLEWQVLIAIVTVAVIAYRLSFRQRTSARVHYFAFLAITSVLIATASVTTPVIAGVLWSVFAVLTIAATQIVKSSELVVHTTIYAIAAAIAAGLLAGSMMTIGGVGSQAPITYSRMMTAMLVISATIVAFMTAETPPRRDARISRVVLLAVTLVITIAGIAVIVVHVTGSDPGVAAAIRSVIIALAAVGLAFASRTETFADATYLVYPLLGVGAAKFVVDDFLAGRAATLFVTLAVYGCALLVLAKMRRNPVVPSPRAA
ncbi:MAG: hypothetical protein ACXW29_12305 [Thermoanaerobaculia bacterium]